MDDSSIGVCTWQESVFSRIADALERIAEAAENRRPARGASLERLALAALMEAMPAPDVSAIADSLGVTRQHLYNLPKFRAALRQARGNVARGKPRRGFRTDDGVESEVFDN